MALWRDPFDDLIEELDRVVPLPLPTSSLLVPFEELMEAMDILMYGSEERVERFRASPEFQGLLARLRPNPSHFRPRTPQAAARPIAGTGALAKRRRAKRRAEFMTCESR
jgi:hypothetical protein